MRTPAGTSLCERKNTFGRIGSTSCLQERPGACARDNHYRRFRPVDFLLNLGRRCRAWHGGARAAMLFCSPCSTVPSTTARRARSVKKTRQFARWREIRFHERAADALPNVLGQQSCVLRRWRRLRPKLPGSRRRHGSARASRSRFCRTFCTLDRAQQLRHKIFDGLRTVLGNAITERLGVLP